MTKTLSSNSLKQTFNGVIDDFQIRSGQKIQLEVVLQARDTGNCAVSNRSHHSVGTNLSVQKRSRDCQAGHSRLNQPSFFRRTRYRDESGQIVNL